jgi:hypothetical protein
MYTNPSNRQPTGGSPLRSLHSQISNAVIDYSPWMRRPQKSAGTTTTLTAVVGLPRRFSLLYYSNKNPYF